VIVTVSREYGAGGLGVSDGVARALGYELLTDELPRRVAERLGVAPEAVAQRTDANPPLADRFLERLGAGTSEMLPAPAAPAIDEFDDVVRREIERTIRERAEAGNVVILGRNASIVLGARPDLVRVFLVAARDWRVAQIMRLFGQNRAEAGVNVDRIDVERRKFTSRRYKATWGDPHNYDLVIDTSRFGIEGAVETIVAAVRTL
jgi:cytidylate kinase